MWDELASMSRGAKHARLMMGSKGWVEDTGLAKAWTMFALRTRNGD